MNAQRFSGRREPPRLAEKPASVQRQRPAKGYLMSKLALIVGFSVSVLAATMASASAQNTPQPYVYYVVPCNSPGAIPAAPADWDPNVSAGPPTCVVPVDTMRARAVRREPYYSSPWPYYGSVGVAYYGGRHHDFSHSPHGGHGGYGGGHGGHGGGHGRH